MLSSSPESNPVSGGVSLPFPGCLDDDEEDDDDDDFDDDDDDVMFIGKLNMDERGHWIRKEFRKRYSDQYSSPPE